MALDPHEIVSDLAARAHRPPAEDPPPVLRHPPGPGAPLPAAHRSDELAALHQTWAQVHADERHRTGAGTPPGTGRVGALAAAGAVRTAVRTRLAAADRPSQEADRSLIGDLIRAVDALARRVDEVGGRVMALEALVEEVVVVTSADLARLRASGMAPPGGVPSDASQPTRDRHVPPPSPPVGN